jgi:hypothetical protein
MNLEPVNPDALKRMLKQVNGTSLFIGTRRLASEMFEAPVPTQQMKKVACHRLRSFLKNPLAGFDVHLHDINGFILEVKRR